MADAPVPVPGEIALVITGKDIWEKLDRIEAQVNGLPKKVDDHETRIRLLERKIWGASAVVGFLAAGGATVATRLIGG